MKTYDIPQHWQVLKLRQILRPFSEKNHPELPLLSVVREKGVIIRNTDSKEENHNYIPEDLSGYKKVKIGQFAMNKMKAWQGSYGISKYEGIVSPAYFVFDVIADMNLDFFNLAIRSKVYISYFGRASDGIRVGQWDLSMNRMKEIPFFIPPRKEQNQIVRFLDWKVSEINRLIALKKRQIIDVEKLKTSEIINKFVFSENDKAKRIRLKNIAKSYGRIGFRGYSTTDMVGEREGAITTSPSNIEQDRMSFEKCAYLSWEKYEESPEIQLRKNDILIVKTGSSYGKTGFIENNLTYKATINPQLLIIRNTNISVFSKYLYLFVKYGEIQDQICRNVIGSTIPTISESRIMNMDLLLPNYEVQIKITNEIQEIIDKYFKLINILENEISVLQELKTRLISDAVTGKIDVRGIEIPEYKYTAEESDSNSETEESDEQEDET